MEKIFLGIIKLNDFEIRNLYIIVIGVIRGVREVKRKEWKMLCCCFLKMRIL